MRFARHDTIGNGEEDLAARFPSRAEWKRNGFENDTDSEILYDPTTRVVVVQPKAPATEFYYYNQGVRYKVSAPVSSLAHPDLTDEYFFYWDSFNLLQFTAAAFNIITDAPIAVVPYNDVLKDGWAQNERHVYLRNPYAHYEFHFKTGAYWIPDGGLGIDNYTLQPGAPVNSDNQFSIDPGILNDEDLANIITGLASGSYKVFKRVGTPGPFQWTTESVPVRAGGSYLYWNQLTGGSWQETVAATNNYVNYYAFIVPAVAAFSGFDVIIGMGQNVHSTLLGAQNETIVDFDFGNYAYQEILSAYKITFRTSASYTNTGKCRIEAVDDTRLTTGQTVVSSTPASSHNGTSGKQGGSDILGEFYHMTLEEHTNMGKQTMLKVSAAAVAEGNKSIAGFVNKADIKAIYIKTTSTNWALTIYEKDDYSTAPKKAMVNGNADKDIYLDHLYEDQDASAELHYNFTSASGAETHDIEVRALELQ